MHMPATTTIPEELHIPQITIGIRLKLARETVKRPDGKIGYDQRELAAAIGIAVRSVQNYEHGHTQPKRPVLLSWALATGVPLDWLIEGEMPPAECPNCHGEVASGMTCFLCSTQVRTPQPDNSTCHLHLVPTPC